MFNVNFFINFKKYFIVKKEKKKEKNIAIKLIFVKLWLSENIIFFIPKIETAPKIGIDNKKEIFAESILSNFKNLAAVIAIPDLLTPGTKDKICKIPINIADLKLKLLLIFFSNLNLSLMYNKIPKINVVQAIVSKFLIFSIIPVLTRKKPIIITGSEENKIFEKRILLLKKFKISL